MGGLGIEDITIGYSSTGAAKYVSELNTQAILNTSNIVRSGADAVKDVMQQCWQGQACEAFNAKLSQSADTLIEKLKEAEAVFNATMAGQEETYHEQDQGMADEISGSQIF